MLNGNGIFRNVPHHPFSPQLPVIMIVPKPFLLLLALTAEALSGPVMPASCTTTLGTKSVKNVPTSTTTLVKKINIIKKVIRKVNILVVPVAKTTTIRTTHVDTVTYIDQKTDTAWVTLTCE